MLYEIFLIEMPFEKRLLSFAIIGLKISFKSGKFCKHWLFIGQPPNFYLVKHLCLIHPKVLLLIKSIFYKNLR